MSTFFAFVLIFSLLEAYFRFSYDVPDGLGFLKTSKKWQERHVTLQEYNKVFFRDKQFYLAKKVGTTRIGVIGDSISFGGGIEKAEDRFSNLLEKKLIDSRYNVEVYNLGIPGYDTDEELILYNRIKELNFDIIVWQYFLNDIQPQNASTGSQVIIKNRSKNNIAEYLTNKSYFFDFLYWRLTFKYQRTLQELRTADLNQYKNEEVLNGHKQNLNKFIDELQNNDKKILVVIFPSLVLLNNGNYPATYAHDIVKDVFSQKAVKTIDMLPDLIGQKKNEFFASQTDSHPNEFVHNLAAQRIYDNILEFLK